MEKKSKIIILVVILLFIIIGFVSMNQLGLGFFNQTIKVGDVTYDIPNGFHKQELDEGNQTSVKISNGKNTIILDVFNDTNIKQHVNSYIEYVNNTNSTYSLSNVTIDGIDVYKVVSNNTGATHFWYVYNGKTYTMNTIAPYEKTESTLYDMIGSMHIEDK